jgi:dipeptidyl aminopeptidase/acylaminoacyl peptidase
MRRFSLVVILSIVFVESGFAQPRYEKPPKEVLDVLLAPQAPTPFLSPTGDTLALAQVVRYPPISDLAEPTLRLAGVRINPRSNAERSYTRYWVGMTLKRIADGVETPVAFPPGVRLGVPRWNARGSLLALTSEAADGVELWVVDASTGRARRLPDLRVNPALGAAVQWMPDQETLLVKAIPADRGAPPEAPLAPPGPKVQESSGTTVASSTYEARDLLRNSSDADLFDYYTTSRLALVHVPTEKVTYLGAAAVFGAVSPSPGGKHLLVERIHRPYSYLRAWFRFPKEVEVWTVDGERVETLASQPLAEQVPIRGVPTGSREHAWRATAPATVVWAEALDGGNPRTKVEKRDRVMIKPLGGPARELMQTEYRFTGVQWIEKGGLAFVSQYEVERIWTRTYLVDADDPAAPPRLLWDMSADERYRHPGDLVIRTLPSGVRAVVQQGDHVYLDGMGASPEGDRPFLDRLNLRTLATERLFRSEPGSYEYFVAWVSPAAGTFVTRRESPKDPPNFLLRTLARKPLKSAAAGEAGWSSSPRPITQFPDPAPQVRGITKRLVTYTRPDGISLSFTLYLPPGYQPGTRLPTLLWAYPIELAEKEVAGQVEGSPFRFTSLEGTSELFLALQGYAVLDDAAMPVVGPSETVYDSFVEQIVANAKAAIDKAIEMGVTDPNRVAVAGHSHGALMTSNLLAYSDLFRAGIARSGAFNHTLRPFGFQNERRTYWQARDVYVKLSPVLQADRIDEPLLLIHGELDQNPGTVPMQSEKLYEAVRGVGGTVRLVMLPHESHGYSALESTEHVLYEMISWLDRYVKNAPPRSAQTPK